MSKGTTKKTALCKYFPTRSCHKGDDCPFIHDDAPDKVPALEDLNARLQYYRDNLSSDLFSVSFDYYMAHLSKRARAPRDTDTNDPSFYSTERPDFFAGLPQEVRDLEPDCQISNRTPHLYYPRAFNLGGERVAETLAAASSLLLGRLHRGPQRLTIAYRLELVPFDPRDDEIKEILAKQKQKSTKKKEKEKITDEEPFHMDKFWFLRIKLDPTTWYDTTLAKHPDKVAVARSFVNGLRERAKEEALKDSQPANVVPLDTLCRTSECLHFLRYLRHGGEKADGCENGEARVHLPFRCTSMTKRKSGKTQQCDWGPQAPLVLQLPGVDVGRTHLAMCRREPKRDVLLCPVEHSINLQFAREEKTWQLLLQMRRAFGREVERFVFNYGKWETREFEDDDASDCHAHAHLHLTTAAVLAATQGGANAGLRGRLEDPDRYYDDDCNDLERNRLVTEEYKALQAEVTTLKKEMVMVLHRLGVSLPTPGAAAAASPLAGTHTSVDVGFLVNIKKGARGTYTGSWKGAAFETDLPATIQVCTTNSTDDGAWVPVARTSTTDGNADFELPADVAGNGKFWSRLAWGDPESISVTCEVTAKKTTK